MNDNEGESCPGAAECETTRGKPLNRYLPSGKPEDEICKGCKLLPTKPEAVPEEIANGVANALHLSELERSGARFAYPDALSATDWASLAGLTRGRERAQKLNDDREKHKKNKK